MKAYILKNSRVVDMVVDDSESLGFSDNGMLKLETALVSYITKDTHSEIIVSDIPDNYYPKKFKLDNENMFVVNPLWIKPESEELKDLKNIIDLLILESLEV